MPLAMALLVSANALKYFIDAGNPYFLHYAVHNASAHASWWAQLIPGGARPAEFFAGMGPIGRIAKYLSEFPSDPPAIWREAGRHVVFVLCWCALGLACAAGRLPRIKRVLPHFGMLTALAVVCTLGYAKFGGYVNNFMPLHLWLAVCAPLAWWESRRRVLPWAADVAFAAILALQALQPWTSSGLLWSPAAQWPSGDDRRAHGAMLDWLRERRAQGERVLVVHHQYYGYLTGHGLATNVDMVRCAQWAGDPVPAPLTDAFVSRAYDFLVLDQKDPEEDWLPPGFAELVTAGYEYAGPLPGSVAEDGRWLMVPRTGAAVRPGFVFRIRPATPQVSPPPGP